MIPALGRQRRVDFCEFQASQGYRERDPVSKFQLIRSLTDLPTGQSNGDCFSIEALLSDGWCLCRSVSGLYRREVDSPQPARSLGKEFRPVTILFQEIVNFFKGGAPST